MPAIISHVYQSRSAGGSFWGPVSVPQTGDLVQGILCGFALPGEAAWPQSACLHPSCVWTHDVLALLMLPTCAQCQKPAPGMLCPGSSPGSWSRNASGAACPVHCILGLAQILLCSCRDLQLLPLPAAASAPLSPLWHPRRDPLQA